MSNALGVSYYCLLDYMEKPSPTKYNQLFETLGSFEAVKKLSAFLLKEEIGSNKKEIILLNELRDQEDCRLLNDNGFELTADYTKLSITEPHGLPGYKLHVKVFKTGVVQKLQKG